MRQRGFTLIEVMTAVAIVGVIVMCSVPAFAAYRRREAVSAQAAQLRSVLRAARMRAIARNANAGVKFLERGGVWMYALYDDGDGDGIRSDDIASGTDRCFKPPSLLLPELQAAKIGVLPVTIRDPDGDPLRPTAPGVQFGHSATCSFSPTGASTPGTVYLVSGDGFIYAVRVYGTSGKVRTLRYNAGRRKWERS